MLVFAYVPAGTERDVGSYRDRCSYARDLPSESAPPRSMSSVSRQTEVATVHRCIEVEYPTGEPMAYSTIVSKSGRPRFHPLGKKRCMFIALSHPYEVRATYSFLPVCLPFDVHERSPSHSGTMIPVGLVRLQHRCRETERSRSSAPASTTEWRRLSDSAGTENRYIRGGSARRGNVVCFFAACRPLRPVYRR